MGANKGMFLQSSFLNLLFMKGSGGGGKFIVLSPLYYTFEILSQNGFSKANNIILNNFGLGKVNEERILYYNKKGSGLASLTKRDLAFRNIPFEESEKVKILTLDSYCQQKSIEHISLLKIDVEGMSLMFLLVLKECLLRGLLILLLLNLEVAI